MSADRPRATDDSGSSHPRGAGRSSVRRRLLDRLALRPSRMPLDPGPQLRHWIEGSGLRLECFRQFQLGRSGPDRFTGPDSFTGPDGLTVRQSDPAAERPLDSLLNPVALAAGDHPPPQRVIIKYAGNAGRAERSTLHPAEAWADQHVEIWTINPPGYGQSPGRASLDHVPSLATAVWASIARHYRNLPDLPVVILGNSIGALTALHTVLAAQSLGPELDPVVGLATGSEIGAPATTRGISDPASLHPGSGSGPDLASAIAAGGHRPAETPAPRLGPRVAGLLLRNPPDLVPLILQHRRRWFHGPVPTWLVRAWGPEVDSAGLIAGCHCPLLLLQSEWDREVPPSNQDRLWDAHPGPKHKFIVPGADHEQLPTPSQPDLYHRYLNAIRTHL